MQRVRHLSSHFPILLQYGVVANVANVTENHARLFACLHDRDADVTPAQRLPYFAKLMYLLADISLRYKYLVAGYLMTGCMGLVQCVI